jgi:hypothetical protein
MISFYNRILYIFTCTALISSNGASASIRPENNVRPKPWKITEQQFLDQYGKDDSSRALIHYYFEKRNLYKKRTIVFAGISGISGILFEVFVGNFGSASALKAIVFGIPLLVGLWGYGILMLMELGRWIGKPRKALFKVVGDYISGRRIPKRIKDSRRFRQFLKAEKYDK